MSSEVQVDANSANNKPVRQPRPVYLDDPRLDRMFNALVELTAQLYIAKDRVRALESLLVERGVLAAGELDAYRGDEALENLLTKEREALVSAVITRNFFED